MNMNDKAVMKLAKSLAGINLTGGTGPLITSKGKPSLSKKAGEVQNGDWMRVRRGPMEGAEGAVVKTAAVSPRVTLVEIRQLNGNVIRLPRSHFEFASYKESTVDRL